MALTKGMDPLLPTPMNLQVDTFKHIQKKQSMGGESFPFGVHQHSRKKIQWKGCGCMADSGTF